MPIGQDQQMKIIKPPKALSQALSQALRKFKPLRKDINHFKTSLSTCLHHIAIAEENKEREENFKQYIGDFLKNTFYQDHHINTKGNIDLAIYSGKDGNSPISVLIETKRPSNTSEFPSATNINKKALHELLLYYLQERVDHKNNNIKHLIVTNGYEWYLFKGEDFYTYFYKNAALQKEYKAHRDGEKDSSKTELFYNEIAKKYLEQVGDALDYVYFNVQDYSPYLDLENKKDNKLVSLYKILSSTHLLNKAFGNDSNQLNKAFYGELLHLIGLEEVKQKGKKVIQRLPKGKREYGSLLESTIFTLEDRDYLHKVPNLRSYGSTKEEQLFSVGLELCLTWINRVLFIKLLESQLLDYHDGDKNYRFLHQDFIKGFDDLEALFFSALAKKKSERSERYQDKYQYIPYLNSSLFEANELESQVMQLSNIKDEKLQLYSKTVLKDGNNKRLQGQKNTLAYLFDFLEAYDFSSDNKNQIEEREQSKALINASVLGLIFEKINGYKDGSFYTPSYITMYMSRETLRRAVVQKMNAHYQWSCSDFEDLKEDLRDHIKEQGKKRKTARLEANKVINSLKICDPAVGSGHFLVSCLNELIAIKSDLKILCDAAGECLDTFISLENDELILEDENGDFFTYNPRVARTHPIQKALFHEKQTLIENCLFAVDINPNSVKICRLRLWIELLKNAYYNQDQVLQTLPNIDINIKCGNSLISRFDLEDDLKTAFKSKTNPYSLRDYKNAVKEYKTTNDKARKREIQTIIDTIKGAFKDTLDKKFLKKLAAARGKYDLKNQELTNLKAFGTKVPKKEKDLLKKLKKAFEKAKGQKEEILDNVIYQNAFEWRFEFPEVLDNKGAFVGFDVVIGNPPYIQLQKMKEVSLKMKNIGYLTYESTGDLYCLFYEKGYQVLSDNGFLGYITSNKWMRANYGKSLRKYFLSNTHVFLLLDLGQGIFEEATVDSNILFFQKKEGEKVLALNVSSRDLAINSNKFHKNSIEIVPKNDDMWVIPSNKIEQGIKSKIEKQGILLKDWDIDINYGIKTGFNQAFLISGQKKDQLIAEDPKNIELIHPILKGRNINKYHLKFNDLWLINTHNGYKETPRIDIEFYPKIKEYLDTYYEKLDKRSDKGATPYNLRNCAYIKQFSEEKIIYQEMVQESSFAYHDDGTMFCVDTGRIITGSNLKYIISVLNSKFFFYCVKYIYGGGGLGTKGVRMKHTFFENFPLIKPNNMTLFETKVNKILTQKQQDPTADTSQLEQEIDVLVYQLYNLTYEEVLIVDKEFLMSKAAYEALDGL